MKYSDCAWYTISPERSASHGGHFAEALERVGVELVRDDPDPQMAAVVWLATGVDALSELKGICEFHAGRVIIVASGLKPAAMWELVRVGASNVLSPDDLFSPGRIAALLGRFATVESLSSLPVVRNNLIGASPVWRRLLLRVVELSRFTDTSLLVTGESGTGKELIARLLHTLDGRERKGELVTLDCTTVSPELSGSEFFGHERGSFTSAVAARDGAFSLADGGTLFLDEVGELPMVLQAELLRVVQERTYKRVGGNSWKTANFRLVCATNRDLRAEEMRGNFRLDFYHRIASATLHLPPLRERREDIMPLARHFIKEARGGEVEGVAPAVEEFLRAREYRGNVRELRQLTQRMAKAHVGPGPLDIGDIPEEERCGMYVVLDSGTADADFEQPIRRALAAGKTLQQLKELAADVAMDIALREAEGNAGRAAERIGVTRRAVELRIAGRRGQPPPVRDSASPVRARDHR